MAWLGKSRRETFDSRGSAEDSGVTIYVVDGEGIPSSRSKLRKVRPFDFSGGSALFADSLKEAGLALVRPESEKLKFGKERYE